MSLDLVLASASPARLAILRAAGFDPRVIVSGVDEDALELEGVASIVAELARQKAFRVTEQLHDGYVLGCDSLLEFDGHARGKPTSNEEATRWWHEMRGREALLFTGHCLVDVAGRRSVSEIVSTAVSFGSPSDEEIDRYVATGEALAVAGAFTLGGRSAPFIEGVRGDANNVEGLSLAALRRLIAQLGLSLTSFWID